MKQKLLLSIFSLLVFNLGFSQNKKESKKTTRTSTSAFTENLTKARVFAPNGVIRCASTEYQNSKKTNGRVVSDQVFEDWIAPKIQEIKRLRQLGRLPAVITIPVVVHVIHNGDAVGSPTGENIADAQVLSQIQVFNEDFRKMTGTPGDGAGVDTMIEFCMAQVDPNGNPTNGIDRRQFTTASYNGAAVEATKATTIWDPTKYLNMWTFRFGGDLNGVLGYAQFPTGSGLAGMPDDTCVSGEASTDGVVAAFNTFGSRTIYPAGVYSGTSYDKGRTMTHEVGHMLGLRHIWGDGGCGVDDFCADTPNCDSDFYAGFPTCSAPTQCGNTRQIENYMDYSDDGCMNVFTQDQKDRMLACLMNSPRRDDLLVSTVCNPVTTPLIQFKRNACETRPVQSVIEGNGCSFTEFTIPLSIDKVPSQNAVVTFAVDGASVANASDMQIMTPSVTFNAGSTADQNLVFRVLNDRYVELDEELILTFTISTSGNAVANTKGSTFSMTIVNDDTAVVANEVLTLFSDDFSDGNSTGWTIIDNNGNTADDWSLTQESNWTVPFGIYTDFFMASYSWNGDPYTPDNFLSTPAIAIPSGVTNINLSYFAGSGTDPDFFSENYQVYVSTSAGSVGAIQGGTLLTTTVIPAMGGATYNLTIPPAFAGQTVYVSFRHYNTNNEWVLGIDEVVVTASLETNVQTTVDTGSPGQNLLNGIGSASFKDASSSNIINTVTINNSNNYGCTTSSVSRAGTGAVQYGPSTNVVDFAMSKQFTITPSNILNGSSTITFYFTEAEVAGWESVTGNTRGSLYVAKDGLTQEIQSLTLGSFGATGLTMTATFATGLDGIYSFASQASLGAESFTISDLSIYPNPNNGTFNVQFNSALSNEVKVNVHDMRGREIFNKTFQNNGMFNESLQLNNVQSGIYLVTVQDGSRKEVKKIVVE